MGSSRRTSDIVRFWRAVELFDVQKVPDPVRDRPRVVVDVASDGLLPWQPEHPVQQRPIRSEYEWCYTVYLGLYEVARVVDQLCSVFGPESPYTAGTRGQGVTSAVMAFAVGPDGVIGPDTPVLSSAAWATGRLRSPGPGSAQWLDGLAREQGALRRALTGLSNPPVVPPASAVPPAGDSEQTARSAASRAGAAVRTQVTSAARDALDEGAKSAGTGVDGIVTAAMGALVGPMVGTIAGPLIGTIAGGVAGKFVEKVLTARRAAEPRGGTAPAGGSVVPTPVHRVTMHDLTATELTELVGELSAALGIADVLRPAGIRVECWQRRRRPDSPARPLEAPMLNSMIADDLDRIAALLSDGGAGRALRDYLTADAHIDDKRRRDVQDHRDEVLKLVAPDCKPAGRWPTETDRPLAMAQQFAVDATHAELSNSSGLFAVNGPPGTGKTTLIRDLIAALVVDRAKVLATLERPSDGFGGVLTYDDGEKLREVDLLRPELTGFEVVVATNGNDAAKNITHEIPGAKAVAAEFDARDRCDYFAELTDDLLEGPSWGLVAAALGNRSNNRAFTSRVLHGDGAPRPKGGAPAPRRVGLLDRLTTGSASGPSWSEARRRFRAACDEVARRTEAQTAVAAAVSALPELRDTTTSAEGELRAQGETVAARRGEERTAADQASRLRARLDDATADLDRHGAGKPGFWDSLVSMWAVRRSWYADGVELRGRQRTARKQWEAAETELDAARAATAQAEQQLARLDRKHATMRGDLARAEEIVRTAPTLPPDADADDAEFEMTAPWADPELDRARSELFLAALTLHKAFVLGTPTRFRRILATAGRVLAGPGGMPPAAVLAAWQGLFLTVPVVSTTFASLPRLFDRVDVDALGWLVVDEAGQATVQSVVGGLSRCRRAVIIGDPMQLEPIVTTPRPAQRALARHFAVDEQWLPDARSAQTAADRLNRFGRRLPPRDPAAARAIDDWIGAPLRVHRRCDRPMFDIANKIAYGHAPMVFGTPQRNEEFPLPSVWFDVRGQARGHVVEEEIDMLADVVAKLRRELPVSGIRVVTPFTDVRRAAAGRLRRDAKRLEDESMKEELVKVGTLHSVQGIEAEAVVLVLGGGPEGARRWVTSAPNLVNVAVTRAQRCFCVIGDRQAWSALPYLSTAADHLGVR